LEGESEESGELERESVGESVGKLVGESEGESEGEWEAESEGELEEESAGELVRESGESVGESGFLSCEFGRRGFICSFCWAMLLDKDNNLDRCIGFNLA
jgi:hypothetical protein